MQHLDVDRYELLLEFDDCHRPTESLHFQFNVVHGTLTHFGILQSFQMVISCRN